MKFKDPVFEGVFVKRYKRFFADIRLKNQTVVAHVANTGSMKGLVEKETPCLVTFNDSPERKLKYSLQALRADQTWVGINTSWPNHLVKEAFDLKKIKKWQMYSEIRQEVKINSETRLDLQLTSPKQKPLYVEVKNVTLARDGVALFPDAVTSRGLKHLNELIEIVKSGHRAEMVFVIQRTDCDTFSAAADIDPEYAKGLTKAALSGVEISAYSVNFGDAEIALNTEREIAIKI